MKPEFEAVKKCPVCGKAGMEGTWSNMPAVWHDGVQDPCVPEPVALPGATVEVTE